MNLSAANKTIVQRYFSDRPVKRAYLFGSSARNEARPDSDIDILVEFDHSKPIGMKFYLYQLELEELLKTKVDLVSIDGLSKYIKPIVDKDKILIYESATER
jgi:predicted nucleotidyltransferase